jgi:hypothetical protein
MRRFGAMNAWWRHRDGVQLAARAQSAYFAIKMFASQFTLGYLLRLTGLYLSEAQKAQKAQKSQHSSQIRY